MKGFSILTAVILVTSITLSIALAVAFLGLSDLERNNLVIQGDIVFFMADNCAEEAVWKLKKDAAYVGETITFNNGACVINVTGTPTKTITATATVGDFTRIIRVIGTVITNPSGKAKGFSVTSWEEI